MTTIFFQALVLFLYVALVLALIVGWCAIKDLRRKVQQAYGYADCAMSYAKRLDREADRPAAARGVDLGRAMAHNTTRPRKHGGKAF